MDAAEKKAREEAQALVDELGMDWDEAVHMLVDAGEIDSDLHERLLSPKERERVYG